MMFIHFSFTQVVSLISPSPTIPGPQQQRGNKNVVSFVRAEFHGMEMGDSQKLDTGVEECVNYNLTCSFECSEWVNTLDDLANNPVIFTLFEIIAKEKKQKEDKPLAQAVVDLLPLLHGQCNFSCTVVLHPIPGSQNEIFSQDRESKPTLDVNVSVPVPLLSDVQLSESNLLSITVETAYSVPEIWNPVTGPKSSYMAAMQVPLTAEREQTLLFANGILKMGGEREPAPRAKKWPVGLFQAPDAKIIPDTTIEMEPTDFEYGDLNSMEDRDFRVKAEQNCKRVSWDTEHRCCIDAGRAACLIRKIVGCRLWPVEVMRYPPAGVGKVKGKDKSQLDDDVQMSFHGVAYVDFAPLLYPGVKRIRGAYRLYPFSDHEVLLQTNRKTSILWEITTTLNSQSQARQSSSVATSRPVPSKVFDAKGGNDSKDPTKKGMAHIDLQVNTEGQMYVDSRSYIVIDIVLEKPLVPKRSSEELAQRVSELIPARTPLPRRPTGAERAVQEYHAQITSVAAQVLQQYEQIFGAAFVPGANPLDAAKQEQRKCQLFGELNCSGKYFALKEQMKYSVVEIVREKMLRPEAFTNPEELPAFLCQLYVFLIDEMHIAFNKTLLADVHVIQPQPMLDCSQLRHLAKEAQLNQDYQLAAYYFQERLTRDQSNPSHWFDYGVLHMLTADHIKAEQCFNQAVSIDQKHIPSLLMCGILSEMNGSYEGAETFFERAICIEPSSIVPWTLLGLFYLAREKIFQADMAFQKANKHLSITLVYSSPERDGKIEAGKSQCLTDYVDNPVVEGAEDTEEGAKSQNTEVIGAEDVDKTNFDSELTILLSCQSPIRHSITIYMETVKFVLENYALQMAQRALAQELLCSDGCPSSSYHLALAHLQLLRGEYSSAKSCLQEALTDNIQNHDVWALYGHLYYTMKNYDEAQRFYERMLEFVTDASDMHFVYLRLGSIYLQRGEYRKAKPTYMHACKSSPSYCTWLGLGIACYRLEELTEAEEALSEANTLNNRNPEVWGYLSLVCLRTGRKVEAEQSFKCALKFHLKEEALLQEIRELQAHGI